MAALDAYRDLRDAAGEATFHAVLRLAPGAGDARPARLATRRPGRGRARSPRSWRSSREQTEALLARMGEGGLREAFIRALIYIRLPQLAADERGFRMLQKLRDEHATDVTLAEFKSWFRDQFLMVLLDPEQAVRDACPSCSRAARPTRPRLFAAAARRCWRSAGRWSRSRRRGCARGGRDVRRGPCRGRGGPAPRRRLSGAAPAAARRA